MTSSERQRLALRESLTSVIGADSTEVLMGSIPPFDWARIATRDDLRGLEERLELRFDSMLSRRLQTSFLALVTVMVSLHAVTIGMVAWVLR